MPHLPAWWPHLSQEEWQIIFLTLRVAGLAVAGGLPVAVLLAAILGVRFPGRFLLNAVVHLPLALPPVVTGWLLLILCGVEGPVGAWVWQRFGIRLAFTTEGAALACAVMVLPLMVRAVRQGLDHVDPGLQQAAQSLGAGAMDRFFSITLPLAGPGVLMAATAGFTASLGEFGAVITFAANIPGETRTLPLAIYSALQVPGGEAEATRLAVCSVVLAIAGLLLADRFSSRQRRHGAGCSQSRLSTRSAISRWAPHSRRPRRALRFCSARPAPANPPCWPALPAICGPIGSRSIWMARRCIACRRSAAALAWCSRMAGCFRT
jgi:molybdate transport system permease protein